MRRAAASGLALALLVACGAPARPPAQTAGETDTDGDGVVGAADLCPDDPEDVDGFEDTDGCLDDDNDGDRIRDVDDMCPDDPEDRDGFDDDDGCPDPDNDADRILDVDDQCPDEAETYNGTDDEDGCPDSGCLLLIDTRIQLAEELFFPRGSSELDSQADPVLDAVAEILRVYRRIRRLGVFGSVARGEPRALARRRAETLRDALVQRGVEAERLRVEAVEQPRDTGDPRGEHNRVAWVRIEERSFEEPPAQCGQTVPDLHPQPWEEQGLNAPPGQAPPSGE